MIEGLMAIRFFR